MPCGTAEKKKQREGKQLSVQLFGITKIHQGPHLPAGSTEGHSGVKLSYSGSDMGHRS